MFEKSTPEKIATKAKDQWDGFAQAASSEWEDLKDKANDVNPFREKTTWEKIKDQFTPEEKNAWEKLADAAKTDVSTENLEIAGIILGTLAAFGLGYALHAIISKKKA
ncbi:hypothetical protein [Allofustis seminis]|uniref:hypothetical protein n=1 Tax=Allofustis seminis TaxID=166939 RepID=UPI00037B586B|nr:hypothetical protein [Allofustis seminis]